MANESYTHGEAVNRLFVLLFVLLSSFAPIHGSVDDKSFDCKPQRGPPGPRGPTGPQGPKGIRGRPGPTGVDGFDGLTGPIGATGPQGCPGFPGLRGSKGPTGFRGAQGHRGMTGLSPMGPIGPTGTFTSTVAPFFARYAFFSLITIPSTSIPIVIPLGTKAPVESLPSTWAADSSGTVTIPPGGNGIYMITWILNTNLATGIANAEVEAMDPPIGVLLLKNSNPQTETGSTIIPLATSTLQTGQLIGMAFVSLVAGDTVALQLSNGPSSVSFIPTMNGGCSYSLKLVKIGNRP